MKTQHSNTADMMRSNASKAEALLKQLANRNRLMVLCALASGEKTVSELLEMLDLSQSALSQHLAKMRDAGLVASEKRGQMVYYSIQGMEVNAILSTLYLLYCRK